MRNLKFYIILSLNLLVLILALWLKPRFQTNDDIGMIYAYSGTAIFDEPTAVTAFATKTWGLIMTFLYSILPFNIEVYTITLFILILLSNIIIQVKLFENLSHKRIEFWFILIPILCFISINFYLELQFTMVAGLLCLAGVLAILNKPSKSAKIIGYVLILISSLLRPSVIPAVLAFLFLLSLTFTLFMPTMIDTWKHICKMFVIFIMILCSVYFMDKKIHTQAEKHFLSFNFYRGSIVDFNIDNSNTNLLPSDWGKEELSLFKNWFYNDTVLYSSTRDYMIVGKGKSNIIEQSRLKNLDIKTSILQFKHPLMRCILILALLPLAFVKQWQKSLVFLILTILTYILFYNLLTLFLKTPPFRVSFMLFASGILLHVYCATKMMENNTKSKIKVVIPALLLIYGLWITKISLIFRNHDIAKAHCTEIYNTRIMYIRWANYPFELVDPFSVSISMQGIKIINLGAFSIHPAVKNTFEKFKYNNLTKDIIGNDSFISFMMPKDTTKWTDFKDAYSAFIAKRYKRTVVFEKALVPEHCYDYCEFKLIEKFNAKLD